MRVPHCLLLITAVAALHPTSSAAATLRVERDGSGDFTTIQAAVDAAAGGDLILIGPGRYDDIHTVQYPDGPADVLVDIYKGDLTFRGTDRDAVIVGPANPAPPGVRWWGLNCRPTTDLVFEDLTIENLYTGISYSGTGLTVRTCVLRRGEDGIFSSTTGTTFIERCTFSDYFHGLWISDSRDADAATITGCQFFTSVYGMDSQVDNTLVQDCYFLQCVAAIQFSFAATGAITRSIVESGERIGVALVSASTCTITDSVLEAAEENLIAWNDSHATGTGNTLPGGSYSTITFRGQATADLHDSHILHGTGPTIRVTSASGSGHIIDLRNNYWGTTDAQQIAEWIIDHNDNPLLTGTVLFEPFLEQPVPAPGTSFGGLKARYGGQGQ